MKFLLLPLLGVSINGDFKSTAGSTFLRLGRVTTFSEVAGTTPKPPFLVLYMVMWGKLERPGFLGGKDKELSPEFLAEAPGEAKIEYPLFP